MLAAALALGGLAACTRHDAAAYIASANSYIAKADYKAAIIEIKNALQEAPDNTEARMLLARALFATGDIAGAETEVRKAIDQRAPDDETYPLLAKTLVAQGKFGNLLSDVGTRKLGTPAARAELGVSLAAAYAAQGNAEKAQSALDAVLAEKPDDVQALLLKAQLAVQGGDLAAARTVVASALAKSPDDADALVASGQLELASGNQDEAQKLYERAIEKHPGLLAPRYMLASLALRSGKVEIAKEQVAKMKEIAPGDGRTIYADALLAFVENDNARARDTIQKVLAINPDHMPSVLLWGLVNMRLGSYAVAEDALRRVASRAPEDSGVARVLAGFYLRTGRASEAVQALEPALRRAPDDPVLLRAAGEAYLAAGDAGQAARSYERANALDKTNVGSKVRLAQVRMAAGDTARAFSDLESLATNESTQFQADLALFTAHLRRREYDQALQALAGLEKKQPKSAMIPFMRGIVYFAKRDLKTARTNFEKALELQPDFDSPAYSLALIDMQEGQPQRARERYDRMLAKYPNNERLLLAQAELLAVTGGSAQDVRAVLDKAVAANPSSVRPRLALINYLARHGEPKAAVDAAQSAVSAIPNNVQALEALGAVQLASGAASQAVDTFKKVVELQPQNPVSYLRLAEIQNAAKDYESALVNEHKAIALKPDIPQAYLALARTYVLSGHPDDAIAEARKLQKEHPRSAIGYALEGEILVAQKKLPEAADAFKAALAREPQPQIATRTYAALLAAGKGAEAAAFAKKWMGEHPQDVAIPLLLAQEDLQRKDLAAAKAGYQRVLRGDPDNTVALNNLAWILVDENDPKGLEYAEEAHRMAPFNPTVLDTLGWALTRNGQAKRGAELLRMATALAPANADIRMHLAKALLETGDKAGARQELTTLSKLDKSSPIRTEAEKLLASP